MKKIFDIIEKVVVTFITAVMFVFITLVAVQVIWRYVLSNPLPWTEQAARYLFIWMLMLAMPILVRRKSNMAFDLLYNRFPEKVQHFIQILTLILIAAFGVVYFMASMELCIKAANKTAIGLGIPMVWVYGAQPVGAGLLVLTALEQIIEYFAEWSKKRKGAAE